MKTRWSVLGLTALSLLLPRLSVAQLLTVRTTPIAQADQFDIFPSQHLGMGGVSIAISDTLLDPFRNPAKGARIGVGRVFSAPGLFNVSSQSGGGRSLPIGAMLRVGDWFGGLAVALQEIEPGRRNFFDPGILRGGIEGDALPPGPVGFVPDATPDRRAHGNALGTLIFGRRLGGFALGGAVQVARMGAMDGVDMMYTGSTRVGQTGDAFDARIGLLREITDDESFELVAVHNRLRMRHDVSFVDLVWDPATQGTVGIPRADRNFDHTSTWGLHAGYQRPIPGTAWRVGGIVTANHMEHPRVPRFDVMSVPADPGRSDALNLGVGLSRQQGSETFGLDFVYEPMRSHSWAEAPAPTATVTGGTIPAGAPLNDNRFRFSNANIRMGFGWDLDPGSRGRGATMQLGLMVRAVRFRMDQQDFVTGTTRSMAEAWTEWTPTWGLGLTLPGIEVRYNGRVSNGTRRPVASQDFGGCCFAPQIPGIGFGGGFVPGGQTTTLADVHIVTHQISVSLPLR